MATNGRINRPAELEAWRLSNDKTYQELGQAIDAITGRHRNYDCWRRVCQGLTKHPHQRTLDMIKTFLDATTARESSRKRKALRKAS